MVLHTLVPSICAACPAPSRGVSIEHDTTLVSSHGRALDKAPIAITQVACPDQQS